MKTLSVLISILMLLLLSACASVPRGPSVMALPGTNRNYDVFRADEAVCRQYASQQVTISPNEDVVTSAAIGTLIGAVTGAAFGGHDGAEVGAGVGLLFGSAVGADSAQQSAYSAQRQYDNAYVQCMYNRGHRVPVSGNLSRSRPRMLSVPPADANYPPPPPYAPPQSPPPDYFPPPPQH